MTKKRVAAILWRKLNESTRNTLLGNSEGQYDIRLNRVIGLARFFDNVAQRDPTPLGGYTLDVPIEALGGSDPVSETTLAVRYMGDQSKRKDWNIPAQRPDTAYPLWRQSRGFDPQSNEAQFAVIIKDIDQRFHARWLRPDDVQSLPPELKQKLSSTEVDVLDLGATNRSSLAGDICRRLRENFNVLLYGPPGTGKTHLMQQVAELFAQPEYYIDSESERNALTGMATQSITKWTTFHQSYSYEDFVIGLRPNPRATALLSLEATPGLLLGLTEYARQQGKSALLLIDEINRGNVSRVFGEFITLLEPDKRLRDDGMPSRQTIEVTLPYIGSAASVPIKLGLGTTTISNPFTMPRRLYTLASMNSVDKSVAPLDTALRRRFDVVALEPDIDEMSREMGVSLPSLTATLQFPDPFLNPAEVQTTALVLLRALNDGIASFLGPEYRLGQWYLGGMNRTFDTIEEASSLFMSIWSSKLLPQLEELFQGRIEQLAQLLLLDENGSSSDSPITLRRPTEAMTERGAVPYLQHSSADPIVMMRYLRKIARVNTLQPDSQ